MDAIEVLSEFARRPIEAAQALPNLSPEQLTTHPANHPNSVAWLLWHTGREVDVQLSHLCGAVELWEGYRQRFGLGDLGDTIGYGHSAEEASGILVSHHSLLVEYVEATLNALIDYVGGLTETELDEIIDESWDPPVSRGARLVSIIDDAAQHLGQAAYVAGALTRQD